MGLSDIEDLGARQFSAQPCTLEKQRKDQLQPIFGCLTGILLCSRAPGRKLGIIEGP